MTTPGGLPPPPHLGPEDSDSQQVGDTGMPALPAEAAPGAVILEEGENESTILRGAADGGASGSRQPYAAVAARLPKLRDPEPYSGNPAGLQQFLFSCDELFEETPALTDEQRIRRAGSFLTGNARRHYMVMKQSSQADGMTWPAWKDWL